MSPKKSTQKSAKRATAPDKKSKGFTAEERGAMKDRIKEMKARGDAEEAEKDLHVKIAEMAEPYRTMAKRIHAIVQANAPDLSPRTWYGMPAYTRDGKVVCFFQSAERFKTRYATFGFTDRSNLDDGAMWPIAFGMKEMGAAEEARITALVKKAVS